MCSSHEEGYLKRIFLDSSDMQSAIVSLRGLRVNLKVPAKLSSSPRPLFATHTMPLHCG